jgi:hypothetical protein
MKPDRLEEFILDNRSEFDDQLPSPESWEKIKTNIRPVRRINWTGRLVRVAATVVIFVSSYIFIDYSMNKGNGGQGFAGQVEHEILNNIPDLVEARAYYSGQIQNMEDQVFSLAGEDSHIRAEIDMEFEELDKVFDELKADLNDNAANEEVVEAMIQNYRIKVQILEQILLQLKNQDEKNIEDDEDKKVLL